MSATPVDAKRIERQALALFERSHMAMLLADGERRYVDCNPAACALLRLAREDIVGRRIDDFAPPELRGEVEARWRDFLASGIQAGEWTMLLDDGTRVPIEYRATAGVMPDRHLTIFLHPGAGEGASPGRGECDGRPVRGHPLTPREREVLSLVARGLTTERIAEELVVSGETVRTHVRNALDALGARTRAHAIALALRQGLIDV